MFEELLKKLSQEFSRNKIPYMIIGGQAVLLYGEPRLTKDIDITLGIGTEDLKDIKKVIDSLGLKPLVKDIESFANETMVLPAIDKKSGIRVDFVFSYTDYEAQAIKRAKKVKIKGVSVNFVSLEDLIIHKLFAKRPRDLEDIKIILLKNPKYDKKYILANLKKFDISLNENFTAMFHHAVKSAK